MTGRSYDETKHVAHLEFFFFMSEFSPNCGDSYPESVVKVIKSFQKFCTLMWLLHVRDEVALSSRAYRKVKQGLFEVRKK